MPSHCRILVRALLARSLAACAALLSFAGAVHAQELPAANRCSDTSDLKVLSWNIWHGGREDGKEVGPARIIDVIRDSAADIVAMQETYGSGELIAKALGFHFLPRGTNVSIHSRYPIQEDISVHKEFECVGALIELPNGSTVLLVNVHFDWVQDDGFRFAQAKVLAERLRKHAGPFVLLGDFNDGPDSRTLAVFDEVAQRAVKPASDRLTFSSTKPEKEIDFIFCAPKNAWSIGRVEVIREPMASDHRPVVAELVLRAR